jgi:hypothetical protein
MIGSTARLAAVRSTMNVRAALAALLVLAVLAAGRAPAAEPAAAKPPLDPRALAPIDLTGYWVSLVTEDWRFRMIVADPGDVESIPLSPAGREAAKAWDAAKDKADPQAACKAFGAAGIMRIPGRVHISWQDGTTLKVQTDAGSQERLFHFGGEAPVGAAPSWQGYSVASWDGAVRPANAAAPPAKLKVGFLKVTTSGLRPGYLRTNGVPYSGRTQLLEYYDTFTEPDGNAYLVVTTVVQDPDNLTEPFVTSSHFRKIPDGQGWDPTPCRSGVPR